MQAVACSILLFNAALQACRWVRPTSGAKFSSALFRISLHIYFIFSLRTLCTQTFISLRDNQSRTKGCSRSSKVAYSELQMAHDAFWSYNVFAAKTNQLDHAGVSKDCVYGICSLLCDTSKKYCILNSYPLKSSKVIIPMIDSRRVDIATSIVCTLLPFS